MASHVLAYTTKELSKKTWPDFERLFSQKNGWDFCWCMAFQRPHSLPRKDFRTRAEQGVRNHEDKRELVEKRRAHGILVYAKGEPVGWCQYGPKDELPIFDNSRKNSKIAPKEGTKRLWRIMCFVTDKRYRRKGVAALALRAVLHAIRKKGGGLVQAYPIAHWFADHRLGQLIRAYGRESAQVRRHIEDRRRSVGGVFVQGVGPVAPVHGTFGNVSTQGTVSMFEKAGFKAVAVVRRTHVLMQRTV